MINDESSSSSSSSSSGYATDTRTTRFGYTDDSWLKWIKCDNAATGQQTTEWIYGVTPALGSELYSNRLVYQKKYPDTTGGSDLVSYKYNRQQQVIGLTDQAGTVHAYAYDKLGRLLSDSVTAFGSGVNNTLNKLERAYNERGLLVRAASYNTSGGAKANEVAWDYNTFNQPTVEYQEHGGAVNKGSSLKVQYSYANGAANTIRPTGITSPNGTVITTAYDSAIANALSRPDAVKESSTTLAAFKYLGLSALVNLKYDAAANAEWTLKNGGTGEDSGPYTGLDRFGRLVETLWKTSSATLVNTTYGRNRVGGVTWKRDVLAHAGSVATEDHFYWYDRLQQNYQHERGALTPGGGPPYTGINPTGRQQQEIRSFDETGNWLTDVASASSLNQSRTHNKANEITDLTGPGGVIDPAHSAVGNMTTMPKPGAWTTSCAVTWDAWNRPVTFNDGAANSYKYDALHRRIAKTTASPAETRDFYFDNQWRAIEERVGGSVKAHYVWSPTDRWTLIRRKRSVSGTLDETLFLLKDDLDPAAIINTSVAVQERFSFDAFGPVRFLTAAFGARGSSSFGWNFLFHAEFRDEESGLYDYGYRYYHPSLGRWLSKDPLEEEVGWNLYSIVQNDVPNWVDYLGMEGENWFPKGDPMRPYGDKGVGTKGQFCIAGHGSPTGIQGPDGKIKSAAEVAKAICQNPDYKPGMPVSLCSCYTGATHMKGEKIPESFAQNLANELKKQCPPALPEDPKPPPTDPPPKPPPTPPPPPPQPPPPQPPPQRPPYSPVTAPNGPIYPDGRIPSHFVRQPDGSMRAVRGGWNRFTPTR